MIKNWNEIDMEMFKEILDSYWNKEDWTLDKVLEIQYLDKILDNKSSTRVYLGNGININEWKDFNKSTLDLMDMLTDMFMPDKSIKEILSNTCLSMCILEDGPRITPLSNTKDHYNLLWSTSFGHSSINKEITNMISNPIVLWYWKDDNYFNIGSNDLSDTLQEKDKLVRLRGISLDTWKDMIYKYIESGFDSSVLHTDSDLPKELIRKPF